MWQFNIIKLKDFLNIFDIILFWGDKIKSLFGFTEKVVFKLNLNDF